MMTIEEYLFLKGESPASRSGNKLMYPCPLHDDRNPSFQVICGTPGKSGEELFRCYSSSCAKHGTIIELIHELEGLPYWQCYQVAGGDALPSVTDQEPTKKKEKELATPLQRKLLTFLMDWCHEHLLAPHGIGARNYLLSRGVSNQAQLNPIIGYFPRDYNGKLLDDLIATIRDDDTLGMAGLAEAQNIGILKVGNDRKLFLPLQNRVIFFCLDPTDMTPVYYQARAVEWKGQQYPPRYKVIGSKLTKFPFWFPLEDYSVPVTIATESAFGPASLAYYNVPSIATLGEGLNIRFLHMILKRFPRPVFWGQDNDIPKKMKEKEALVQAGEKQARKWMTCCDELGIENYRLAPKRYDEKHNGIDDMVARGDIGEIMREISCNQLSLVV
jgi:hypothetical protein